MLNTLNPGGTIFQGVPPATRLRGALAWLAGGWDHTLPARAVETYSDDARATGHYLRPGVRVTIHADCLGTLENGLVP